MKARELFVLVPVSTLVSGLLGLFPFQEVSAQQVLLVKDINPGPEWGGISAWKTVEEVNGRLIFLANNGLDGEQLWTSDGTAEGTVPLTDFAGWPWPTVGTGEQSSRSNGSLCLFVADDGVHGAEPWVTDGTIEGTRLLKDFNPGIGGSYPQFFAEAGGLFFFSIQFESPNDGIWISNGTAEGTAFLKNIRPFGCDHCYYPEVNGRIFFTADDGIHGAEPWISDGTPKGTVLLKDTNPDPDFYGPGFYYKEVNDLVFFFADDGTQGWEPWVSDGTTEGTILLKNINPSSLPSGADDKFVGANGLAFFFANDGIHGSELWASNGTTEGTYLVKDINPGEKGSWAWWHAIIELNKTQCFFIADDGTHGWEPWVSDGTAKGTFLLKDINPGPVGSWGQAAGHANIIAANGLVFFTAWEDTQGREPWVSDGTTKGTFLLKDINPGPESSFPDWLTDVNGQVFFFADDGVHGFELWSVSFESTASFKRADANASGNTDISDAVVILNFLFANGNVDCIDAADVNDDGQNDLADPIMLLNYLFASGPPPDNPFGVCGLDPTPDALTCDSYPPCE